MGQKSRWKFLCLFVLFLQLVIASAIEDEHLHNSPGQRVLFSPRMDYNQWKPLGRGDPLKNDPTFDYVPPVLDPVHYWVDPKNRPPNDVSDEKGKKTEILLLGITSKKPAASGDSNQYPQITADSRKDTVYEPYKKNYQEEPSNYYNYKNQRVALPNFFPSMTSQIIPSIMSLANKMLDRTVYSKGPEPKVPITVLVPPPKREEILNIFSKPTTQGIVTQSSAPFQQFKPSPSAPTITQFFTPTPRPNTQNEVTIEQSNLIYHSSSLGNNKEFETAHSVNWGLTSTTEKSEFGLKKILVPPKSFIKIEFRPQNLTNKILEASGSNHHANYVTSPPLKEDEIMFKGHVSDDNEISNSYVKILKPQAQMDHIGVEINNVHPVSVIYPYAEPFRLSNNLQPISMEIIQDLETMKPPPVTKNPIFTQHKTQPALIKSTNQIPMVKKHGDDNGKFSSDKYIASSSFITTSIITSPNTNGLSTITTTAPTLLETNTYTVLQDVAETTTSTPNSLMTVITTDNPTTTQTLTTDPLFKHYKQPIEPANGPLYLIIQGHSKVKTYKPAKIVDGVMVQETNEIPYLKDKVDYSIKHLHGFENKKDFHKINENLLKQRQARTGNLQTLKHVAQTGYGAINFEKEKFNFQRKNDDFRETELKGGYEVMDIMDITTKKYHKGIVEKVRKLL